MVKIEIILSGIGMSERDTSSDNLKLIWALRILGTIDMLALLAVIMPFSWMSQINSLSGLGPLPDARIVEYLARTTSALYALHGAMILFISADVVRYRPLITFLAYAAVVHGVVLLGIDLANQMPVFWTVAEAPAFAATGILILWLQRASSPAAASSRTA